MEALLEPEKVQRVLSLMGSPSLSDSAGGGGADRFLAHFLPSLARFPPTFSVSASSIKSDVYDYECIGEVEEKYESFSKKLDPSLSGSYWKRCEEATKEGGKISGYAYGI